MNTIQEYQLTELADSEMDEVIGGFTGSGELAHDVGVLVGAAVGAFLRIGQAFYENGGLTGGNTWLND